MNEVKFEEVSNEELTEIISYEEFRLSKMLMIVTSKEIPGTESISMIGEMIERLKKIQSLYIELDKRKKLFVC